MNKSDILEFIEREVDSTDYHLAKLAGKIMENRFCVSTDNGKDKWFKYNGERWITSNGIIHEIKNSLSCEVAQYMAETRAKLRERILKVCVDDDKKTSWEKAQLQRLLSAEKMLYNSSNKSSIVKELESILYREKLPEIQRT